MKHEIGCPKCGSLFGFGVDATVIVNLNHDGSVHSSNDYEFDEDSTSYCNEDGCGWSGPRRELNLTEERKKKITLQSKISEMTSHAHLILRLRGFRKDGRGEEPTYKTLEDLAVPLALHFLAEHCTEDKTQCDCPSETLVEA